VVSPVVPLLLLVVPPGNRRMQQPGCPKLLLPDELGLSSTTVRVSNSSLENGS
jgi:hypothetical protein